MNNNKYKYNLEPRYILLFATVILVVLMFLSYKFSELFAPVRNGMNSLMLPMQKGIAMVGTTLGNAKDNMQDVDELRRENESLRAAYDDLKVKYDKLLMTSYELENLRAMFELSRNYSEYDTVGANVISTDTLGFSSEFTIDKGEEDGMKVDMNVISGNGLVGIISFVGKNYSVVKTIIDNNSNVSATILKSSDQCIVNGNLRLYDEGCIEVSEIPLSSTAGNNYQVVTSEMSSKYHPGIMIGYLSNVTVTSDGLAKQAELIPVVDFSHLETVLVITEVKESISKEQSGGK